MTYVPRQHEILARAVQLGVDLTAPGARARVAQVLVEEAHAADNPPPPAPARHTGLEPILLSRSVSTIDAGQIVVDVHLIPNEHERENRDDRAAARSAERVPDGGADLHAADAAERPAAADGGGR